MKIAVVGCGAVGSYYGAKLAWAGHAVHFLLRSDYDAVRCNGVSVLSPEGDFRVHPMAARSAEEIGLSDLVLIGLKTTANGQFRALLPPLVGQGTAILTLQNGLGNEEQLAQLFSPQQILGGLCFVCLNRLEPGVVRHIDHGLVMLGEFQRPSQPRTHQIATFFREAGVPCSITENLARTHWEKLTWNIPFNGLGVGSAAGFEAVRTGILSTAMAPGACLTTDALLRDPQWAALLRELMLEVISAGRALGHELSDSLADEQIERTKTMGPYKASTLLDFERRQPLELESLFLEPLRQARACAVPVPRLANLVNVLSRLDVATR